MKALTPEQASIMKYWGNNLTIFEVYDELKDESSEYQDTILSAALLYYAGTKYSELLHELRYHFLGY
jgi:hypothetical protein